jgi:hypothetical protein
MNAHISLSWPLSRTVLAIALLLSGMGLSGCAGMGDSFASGAFVDPARYDYYDCKQLEADRKTLATHIKELQALIDKANTGVGGAVVGEIAYRNDYISAKAQAKLAEETWQRNKCHESPPDTAAAAPLTPAAPVKPKGAHSSGRSGNAVY